MTSKLQQTTAACRGAFLALGGFSALVNLLMLTAPLYMLQVFDRVLTSQSTDTLLALSLLALVALLTLAALETVRSLALVRIGNWLDTRLSRFIMQASITGALERSAGASVQGLRDLATLRGFVAGPSMFPLMDAPWTPLFLAVIFMLHPVLGFIALGGALVLLALAVANELATRTLLARAGGAQIDAMAQAESAVRNADAIEAMGMLPNLLRRWQTRNAASLGLQAQASNRSGTLTAISKFLRLALQIAMLGVGAWLVIGAELTAGGMIAGTILLGRALAPIDQAMNAWKGFVGARSAYARLSSQLEHIDADADPMALPRPQGQVSVEAVSFSHAERGEPILRDVSFTLPAGKALGLVGPAATGKTTVARLILGNLTPLLGHVRLDGMEASKWQAADRGQYVGYLPQDIELFAGTVRENIARMGDGDTDVIIEAAKLAGVHELILRLPSGYETEIGDAGYALSGGQRQRIALARAVYGNPSLVVLDEPNSNLDQSGIEALLSTLNRLKQNGTSLVVITHQPSIVQQVDYLVVLGKGTVQLAGPREEVIKRVTGPQPAANAPARAAS